MRALLINNFRASIKHLKNDFDSCRSTFKCGDDDELLVTMCLKIEVERCSLIGVYDLLYRCSFGAYLNFPHHWRNAQFVNNGAPVMLPARCSQVHARILMISAIELN